METFQIFTKICGDIHNFAFTDGVVDIGGKLFTGVTHDTSDISSPVSCVIDTRDYALFQIVINSITSAINLSPITTTPAIIIRQ
jgi:hypothetical protein